MSYHLDDKRNKLWLELRASNPLTLDSHPRCCPHCTSSTLHLLFRTEGGPRTHTIFLSTGSKPAVSTNSTTSALLVREKGFEPLTSQFQAENSTRLSYTLITRSIVLLFYWLSTVITIHLSILRAGRLMHSVVPLIPLAYCPDMTALLVQSVEIGRSAYC